MTVLPRVLAAVGVLALGLGGALVVAGPAAAATTFEVRNNSDDVAVPNSLAWAIDQANSVTDGVITFDMGVAAVTSPLTLALDLPDITAPMTITGPGSAALTIDAPHTVFFTSAASGEIVTITGLTLSSAFVGALGIDSQGPDLTVNDIVANDFKASTLFDGAGISVMYGSLDASDVITDGNDNYGIFQLADGAEDGLLLTRIEADNNGLVGIGGQLVGGTGSITTAMVTGNGSAGLSFGVTGGTLGVDDVTASNNPGGINIGAEGGAIATVTNSTASGTSTIGGFVLTTDGAGTELHASGLTVTGTQGPGFYVYALDNSLVTIADSTATGNYLNGFDLTAQDSTIRLSGSLSENNGLDPCGCGGSGVYLNADNSTISIDNTRMIGNHALFGGGLNASILINASTVTVSHSTISGNDAFENATPEGGDGGGIAVAADAFGQFADDGTSLTISDSVVTNNSSVDFGGGIYFTNIGNGTTSTAHVTVVRTTVDGNNAGGSGGGIAINGFAPETSGLPTVLIDSSTLSNNTSPYLGGGIHVRNPSGPTAPVVKLVNSTITGNDAQAGGGFDASGTPMTIVISHSTIADNSAHTSGGVAGSPGTLEIDNSILSGATSNNGNTPNDLDVGGAFIARFSLVEKPDAGVIVSPADGNITGVSPALGALANNGGPTMTMLIAPGSPAYNSGDPAFVGAGLFDQRGQARVYQRLDMGAVEWQPALAHTGTDLTPGPPLIAFLLLFSGLAMVAFSQLRMARSVV